jgi:trehalose 6-phosphate phosphatase
MRATERQDGDNRLPAELRRELRRVARTPHLLVGCDYDGTLAPIIEDPSKAFPLPESITAVRSLASLASTSVAVVSGRALRDLATLSRLPPEVFLVGSHGSEFDLGFVHSLTAAERERMTRLSEALKEIVEGEENVSLETKPASIAVHVRRADEQTSARVLQAVGEGPATWDGIQVTRGKQVIELAVVETDKGSAFDQLRHRLGVTAAIFIGDDVTDEKVFIRLSGPDLGIKVGPGDTAATAFVDTPEDVALVLATLAHERNLWLAGADSVPIEDHALLSDGFNTALLTPAGRISWMCYPEVDSAAIFADLLGAEGDGHFTVEPLRGGRPLGQSYVPDTMTVRTRWAGLTVLDYLEHSHRSKPGSMVVTRLTRVLNGRVPARIVFAPRPGFGSVHTRLVITDEGIRMEGGSDPVVLRCPEAVWTIQREGMHDTAIGVVDLQGSEVAVELRTGTDDISEDPLPELRRRRETEDFWRAWVRSLELPLSYTNEVIRSALTIKALCHQQTGAILAAATTSLPEGFGGIRNWDYRYCWIRDAAMSAHSLLRLGSTAEAQAYLSWLHIVLATASSPEHLHPLYTIHGTALGPEAVVDTLPGYAGSRPVRVGNAAQGQVQLDVFGPVIDLLSDLVAVRDRVTPDDQWLTEVCMEAVRNRWQEPDHGIWEIRDEPRHHVHSRVMCWATIARGLEILRRTGADVTEWEKLRDEIAADILSNGWSEQQQAFVAAYDRDELDASALYVVLMGLLPQDDPRLIATVHAVEAELRVGTTVLRYKYDDGLPGAEGGMTICTSWLVECYIAAGLVDEAIELFEQILDAAGETGLLPEQFDPATGRGMGNHPQAYSHLGVIQCALALDRARRQEGLPQGQLVG